MPYRGNNYSFVIDSSFRPFSFQEMLAPLAIYKDASEKAEEAYTELKTKAGDFAYLSQTLPEGSKAREIYEGYANDLNAQAEDFAQHGLSMGNRRALTGLKQRYQGEIGRLSKADAALRKERELRRQMGAKDSSLLYAANNLNIDDFLDNNTPNLYSISGNELYTKGAAAGQAASKRVYGTRDAGSTLGGYYRDYVQQMGYSAETINKFRQDMSAIPELQAQADAILQANGVYDNLDERGVAQARAQVINGMIDGAVYTENHNLQRDLGKMTAAEEAADARARASHALQERQFNEVTKPNFEMQKQEWEDQRRLRYTFDESGNVTGLNPNYVSEDYEVDPNTGKLKKKKSSETTEEKKAAADESKKGVAMLKLEKGDLAHNEGFDVTFGDNRHHYNYIGAISRHGNKWHTGAIGEDNPGHNWGLGWGFGSTSNVENAWGNFSAEGSDSKQMRVLSSDEFMRLVSSDPDILTAIEERCEAAGVDPTTADIQIVEVPNEKGGGGQKGYLIAVH